MDDMLLTEQEAPHAHARPQPDADFASGQRRLAPEEVERLVLTTVAEHADQLLRTARRYSICAADAEDAYQRALEIFMGRAATLDAERAPRWLSVVVRHEALAVRKARRDVVASPDFNLEALEAPHVSTPEEHTLAAEDTTRAAEALQRLKPQELRAMWLKAMGHSYQEICDSTGWTYTKVNRNLTEGRRTFLERYAGIEAGRECQRWAPVLSAIVDGEATAAQLAEARPHLRNCPACRATVKQLRYVGPQIAVLLPPVALVPAVLETGGGQGLAGRVWDGLVLGAYDRATTAVIKVQALVEAATTTKAAAVVASAAAVAGGGAAVAERAVTREVPDGPRTSAARTIPTKTIAPPAPTRAAVPSPGITTLRAAPAVRPRPQSSTPAETKTTTTRAEATSVAREFIESDAAVPTAARPTAAAAAAAVAAASTRSRKPAPAAAPVAIAGGGEFDP